MTVYTGILLALACAFATNLGFLYKHRGACAAALVLLGLTVPVAHGAHSQFSVAGMIGFEAGLVLVGGLLIIGPRIGAPGEHHGVMLGAAAGILFGVSDVAIKAITGLAGDH